MKERVRETERRRGGSETEGERLRRTERRGDGGGGGERDRQTDVEERREEVERGGTRERLRERGRETL